MKTLKMPENYAFICLSSIRDNIKHKFLSDADYFGSVTDLCWLLQMDYITTDEYSSYRSALTSIYLSNEN